MTQKARLQPDPGDSESRRDTVRKLLLEALALAMATTAVAHYNPDGTLATIVVFFGAYAIATFIGDVLWTAGGVGLCWVAAPVYLCTLVLAFTTLPLLPAMLLTIFLPGIGQAYLIWAAWPKTADLFHPLTFFCVIWVVLFAAMVLDRNWRARWWRPQAS